MKGKWSGKKLAAALAITGMLGPVLAVAADDEVDSLLSMVQKGTVSGYFRTLYYDMVFDGETPNRATLGMGGNLGYESASLYGFNFGVGFKTGQGAGLNDKNDTPYGGMLAQDSHGNLDNYSALDEYYVHYKGYDTSVTLGAHLITTPFLKGHDLRLTPKKYIGASIINTSIEKLEIHAYYIDKYINWTDENFQPISSAFTGKTGDDKGAFIGALVWRAPGDIKIQFWDYYYRDVINETYLKGDFAYALSEDVKLSLDLRYFTMHDTGDGLDRGISTYTTGAIATMEGYGFTLSGFAGTNGDERLITPFGSNKIIIMQIATLERADEDALAVLLSYDFGRLGVPGLSATTFYSHFNTPDGGKNSSPDLDEVNVALRYKLSGWAEGCSLALRYAQGEYDHGNYGVRGDDYKDYRVEFEFRF
ncbi:MAG: OprD family outer membrane porin [Desulfopila sp.]